MSAQSKKSKNSLLLPLALIVFLVLGSYVLLSSKKLSSTTPSNNPTAKPVTKTQNVAPQTVSSTVGRNLLTVKSGPKKGEVTLSWTRYYSDNGKYGLLYSITPGKYTYSVLDAGNSWSKSNTYTYTVGLLKSGAKYYFAVQVPQTNSKTVYVSPEVSIVAP